MVERHFNIVSQVLTLAKAQAEWQLVKAAHAAKDAKKQEDNKKKKDTA